ncbi:MAG TPA: hypothetical protein VK445_09450, partial [Dissulfurispiraceae bacterium]|nr:hypothetical protein [Dissulfurispiraceae bacterium]
MSDGHLKFRLLFTVLILLSAGSIFAADSKPDQQLVRTLMQKSGLSRQIELIPEVIREGIIEANEESDRELDQEDLDALLKKTREAFDAKILIDTVERHLQEHMSVTDIRSVMKWINSPLGRKVSKLEAEASTAAAFREIKKLLEQGVKRTRRTALLAKLDKAVKATDVGVSIAINLQVAFILAATAEMPEEQRPAMEEITKEVKEGKEQLRLAMERETMAGFIYTYRSLTDTEIKRYIAFAESEAGMKYHAVSAEGLNTALTQAGFALGNKMAHDGDDK